MSAPGRPSRDTVAFINEAISQWDDGIEDVGYVARVFASTSLPYRDPGDALPVWQRENGALTLSIQPGPPLRQPGGTYKPTGYPYGSMPRLLLAWLGTEAVRRKERTIPLGESLADFCRQLDIPTNGGANGSLTRLKDQARRLLRARISVDYNESIGDLRQEAASFLQIADRYDLWWNDDPGSQGTLLPSYIELSEQFFTEITERPVPIDLRTLQLLRGAPLRLDIYIWLTYRMSYLRRPSIVTWPQLIAQFGSQAATKQAQRKFKIDFMNHLAQVLAAYPGARVEEHAHGLRLLPGAPAVGRGNRRVLNVPDREVYNPASARPLDGLLRLTKSRAGKDSD